MAVFQFAEDLKQDRVVTLGKLIRRPPRGSEGGQNASIKRSGQGAEPLPDWAKLLGAHRHGNAARPGLAAVDSGGTRHARSRALSSSATAVRTPASSPEAAVELAQEAKIPVFTVGVGSDQLPTNVAVCDLVVPARAYPGDHYTVTGYVQAQGMAGKLVTVQVLSRPANDNGDAARQGTGDVIDSAAGRAGSR